MFFYQVLPEIRLPIKFLTYSYTENLQIGQVVQINIRGKIRGGLIVNQINETNIIDIQKIKTITEILPIQFSTAQMNFLFAFAYNTFNPPQNVFASMFRPLDSLAKKYWTKILEISSKTNANLNLSNIPNDTLNNQFKTDLPNLPKKPLNKPFIDFCDTDITFRIIYLIRSQMITKPSQPILIIFPEKKQLFTTYATVSKELKDLMVNIYTGEKNIDSQQTVVDILTNKTQVVFATRQGLFLPWQTLGNLILVDEANSFYIQDQNQLYYDTRDGAFFLSQNFEANLTFCSTLPSIRLHNFYFKEVFNHLVSNKSPNNEKFVKIYLLKRESKNANFEDLLTNLGQMSDTTYFDCDTEANT